MTIQQHIIVHENILKSMQVYFFERPVLINEFENEIEFLSQAIFSR